MTIKQYIFLRTDLKDLKKGALVAQACHAAVCATVTYQEHQETRQYLEDMSSMHKIILRIAGQDIDALSEALNRAAVDFIAWREQPEDVVTCVSTRPVDLDKHEGLEQYFRRHKLY
ncbi:hypothetical protein PAPHI01_0623 [Pancytospora philotis]|nr:hypothetical protein PAPHI01_0623 [Pancytospora philotis]